MVKEIDPGARIDKKGLVIPKIYEERYLGFGTQWRFGSGYVNWLFVDPLIKGSHTEFNLGLRYGFTWGSLNCVWVMVKSKQMKMGLWINQSV